MPNYDDREREKKSWREIDSSRNKSRHVAQDKPDALKIFSVKRNENKARKALEDLFSGKKNKEQEIAWKKVALAKGKDFATQARAYVTAYGMSRDWNDLVRLLDHPDTDFLLLVLTQLENLSEQQPAPRIELLLAKFRILKMTSEDAVLLKKMDEMTSTLSLRT